MKVLTTAAFTARHGSRGLIRSNDCRRKKCGKDYGKPQQCNRRCLRSLKLRPVQPQL